MIITGESRARFLGAPWMRRLTDWRWTPLPVVLALSLCTQVTLLSIHPHIPSAPDSHEYLAVADRIVHGGQWADPRRTPGYPAFLALIFLVTGGRHLGAVLVVQCALFCVAAAEVYLLTRRMTNRPWIACLATAPVALNIYMLDWAYSIRDEAFSYWLMVTLFLIAERLARRLRPGALVAFTALSALLILTRPLYIALPALILVALAARGVGLGKARQHVVGLGLSLLLVYGLLAGYMALNKAENGYFGVTYVGGVNLFGKVLRYHMQDLPVSPTLQPMQRQADAYTAHGGRDSWDFARRYGYTGDNYAALSQYADYTITHYPVQFFAHTLAELPVIWLTKPGVDARGGNTPAFLVARIFSWATLWTYLALPLVVVWLALLLRKGWRSSGLFLTALLGGAVIVSTGVIAAAAFDEFYRLRAPMDWAYIVVFMLVALDVGGVIVQRIAGGSRR